MRIAKGSAAERAALAERVFGDAERVEKLERLIHPRVVEEQERWLVQQDAGLCVVEVPLLFETGAEKRFDAVVVITAPAAVRKRRKALAAIPERELRLIPDDEKVRRADFVYVNDGSLEELDAWVADVFAKLTG